MLQTDHNIKDDIRIVMTARSNNARKKRVYTGVAVHPPNVLHNVNAPTYNLSGRHIICQIIPFIQFKRSEAIP